MSDRFALQRTIQDPLLEEIENGRLTDDQLEQIYQYIMRRVPSAGRKLVTEKGDARFTAGKPVALNRDGYIATSLLPPIPIGLIPLLPPAHISPQGAGSGLDADSVDGAHYAEGSWSPTVKFGGNAVGVTYSVNNNGVYVKIGRAVMITFRLALSSKGSSTGAVTIGGLPFVVSANSPAVSATRYVGHAFIGNLGSAISGIPMAIMVASSDISLNLDEMTGSQSAMTNAQFANNTDVRATIWYMTD